VPHLFLTRQSVNDDDAVTVRASEVTTTGFKAVLFEEEALMDDHAPELVGYLAIVREDAAVGRPSAIIKRSSWKRRGMPMTRRLTVWKTLACCNSVTCCSGRT